MGPLPCPKKAEPRAEAPTKEKLRTDFIKHATIDFMLAEYMTLNFMTSSGMLVA